MLLPIARCRCILALSPSAQRAIPISLSRRRLLCSVDRARPTLLGLCRERLNPQPNSQMKQAATSRTSAQAQSATHAPPRRHPADTHSDSADDDSASDHSDTSFDLSSGDNRTDRAQTMQPHSAQSAIPRSSMQEHRGANSAQVSGASASQPPHTRAVTTDPSRSPGASTDRPPPSSIPLSPSAASSSCVPILCSLLPLQSQAVASLLPAAVASASAASLAAPPLVLIWRMRS